MFIKGKKITAISNSALSKDIELTNADFSASNLVRLQSQLSFFSHLNINGEISDQAFEALVRYACSIFIKNEVEARVKNALEHVQKLLIMINIYLENTNLKFINNYVSQSWRYCS